MLFIRNDFIPLVRETHYPFHIQCMNGEGDGMPINLDRNLKYFVIVTRKNLIKQLIVTLKCAHGCNSKYI